MSGKRIDNKASKIDSSSSVPGKTHSRRQRRKRAVLTTALIFVVVLAAVFLAIRMFVRPPEGGVLTPDSSEFPPDSEYPDYAIPSDVKADKNIITVLIVGINEGNTDTIMVANIDLSKKVVNAVSIPRDTIVPTTNRSLKKINGAYAHGLKGANAQEQKENAFKQLQQEVALVVGYAPRYYVGVDMNGFVKIVDTIGGVDYEVPTRMYKPGRQLIDLQPGHQHLNGTQALMLVRYRGYGASFGDYHDDFGRMHTQQEFLKVVAKKCASEFSLSTANGYLNVAVNYLTSNMDVGQMGGLLEKSYNWIGNEGSLNFATLPTESVKTPSQAAKDRYYSQYGTISGAYYEQVKTEEALKMINEMINPFTREIDWVSYMNIKS